MKDYHVTLTIKNNFLFRHMQIKGIETAKELAEKSGVSYPTIGNFLSLKSVPMGRDGWKPTVLALAAYFDCKPEDLFPEQHVHEPLKKNKASFEMSGQDVMEITSSLRQAALSPEVALMIGQSKDYLERALKEALNPREYEVLQRRFGLESGHPETLEQIAKSFGLDREWIRQIEYRAMKKIRAAAARDRHLMGAVNAILGKN